MFGIMAGIGAAIGAIGSTIGSVAGSLGGLAATALKVAAPWLGPIANIISAVAQMLGVFKKDDNIEEMGAKAMQPEAKSREDFESYAEYTEHLRNDVELDREKFEKAGPAEKLARTAVGTTIAMRGINEEKGFDIPIEAWVSMGKLGLDETKVKEIDTIIDTFKDGKLDDFAKYVDGKLEGIDNNIQMSDSLQDMYQTLEPNSSQEQIEQKVMATRVGDINPEDIKK
jgi:hypothetical protein